MSILIKGMDMPEDNGCYLLTVRYDADGDMCVYPLEKLGGYDARDLKPDTPMFPLVSVSTSHGRLIDANALLQRAVSHGWSTPKWVSDIAIEDAPTIIPANKERDG